MCIRDRPPPREITDMIQFPTNTEYQFEKKRFYNRIAEKVEQQKNKYSKNCLLYTSSGNMILKLTKHPFIIPAVTQLREHLEKWVEY